MKSAVFLPSIENANKNECMILLSFYTCVYIIFIMIYISMFDINKTQLCCLFSCWYSIFPFEYIFRQRKIKNQYCVQTNWITHTNYMFFVSFEFCMGGNFPFIQNGISILKSVGCMHYISSIDLVVMLAKNYEWAEIISIE